MKKVFISFLIVMSVVSGKVFAAGDDGVSTAAKKAFDKEFPGVKVAAWEQVANADLYMVRFHYAGQGYVAYFEPDGHMLASARLIAGDQLPVKVSHSISRLYANAVIEKIEELTLQGHISYICTLSRNEKTIIVRAYPEGNIQRLSVSKKRSIIH